MSPGGEDTIYSGVIRACMRVGIIGVGALGGLFAGYFAKEGTDVLGFDIDEDLVRTLNDEGLRVTGKNEFHADLEATSDFDRLAEVDGIIVAVKSIHTDSVMDTLEGTELPILTIQNGLGNADIIAARAGGEVINGATFMGARLVEPGHIEETNHAGTWVGPHRGTEETAGSFAAVFDDAGLEIDVIDAVEDAVWTKLLVNAAVNPIAALTRQTLGTLLSDERSEQLLFDVAKEGKRVAESKGVEPLHDPVDLIEMGRDRADETQPSMLQDVQHGRPTEIDFLNGAIVDAAEETGEPAPLNRAMEALVSSLTRNP